MAEEKISSLYAALLVEALYDKFGEDVRAISDAILKTYSDGDDEIGRETIEKYFHRVKRDVEQGRATTLHMARILARPFGYTNIDDWEDCLVFLDKRRFLGVNYQRMNEAFVEQEREAFEFKQTQPAEFQIANSYGSVIELRRFRADRPDMQRRGVAVQNVMVKNSGLPARFEKTLQWPDLHIDEQNWPKLVVSDIKPKPYIDSERGVETVELTCDHTDYFTVRQCDPSIYHDWRDQPNFTHNGRSVDNVQRRANRFKYGHLEAHKNRVPYCLTMFFILLLRDDKVLFMRRAKDMPWFPNLIDISGGEQLWKEDLDAKEPCARWMERAVLEEYLPTKGLSAEEQAEISEEFCGFARFNAIGFDTTTCSFPLFGVYKSLMNEAEYVEFLDGLCRRARRGIFDAEGPICIMRLEQVRELLLKGEIKARRLGTRFKKKGGEVFTFTDRLSVDAVEKVKLCPSDLHPMTPYRLSLLLDMIGD